MYSKLEEDYGLAPRSMAILDRATQAVMDDDKFEVCILRRLHNLLTCHQMYTIYIAKATANFGLPATRPIYERALEGTF